VRSVVGQCWAPQAATIDLYMDRWGEIPSGVQSTTVPGVISALLTMLTNYGTMSFGQVVESALSLASDGFPAYQLFSRTIGTPERMANLNKYPDSARIFLPNGKPPELGAIFQQQDLGRTLSLMNQAETQALGQGKSREVGIQAARDVFYKGDVAHRMVGALKDIGGLYDMDDFADYESPLEEPISVKYRGYEIYTNQSWTQGITLLQTLKILEGYDLGSMGHNSAKAVHLQVEVLKLAMADRERYVGDPAHVDVPFDGATIGFQYRWPFPGRIRFCYGKGFESGFKMPIDRAKDDVDFYGFVWDVLDDPDRNMMLIVQAFKAEGVMDFPEGTWFMSKIGPMHVTTTHNLGDIYELGATWIHKVDIPYLGLEGVDYFISAGLSITDPDKVGMMPYDMYVGGGTYIPKGMYYTLLGGFADSADKVNTDTHTGWAVYVGARIPLPWVPGAKLGLEYNYGSKWWMPFMVATDDVYINKLVTRGHVAEIYWIQDLPAGEALSKYARVFLRLGFQYYWFNYTGSGMWLGEPHEINELDDTVGGQAAYPQMFMPLDHMYNFYASFEVYF